MANPTVSVLMPLVYGVYVVSSNTTYKADINGLVTLVPIGPDLRDLLADGGSLSGNSATMLNLTLAGLLYESAQIGITAGVTRTQAGATLLTKEVNRIDTSTAPAVGTTIGDGVLLMTAAGGLDISVINNTPNIITVYGAGADTINGIAGPSGTPIPPFSVEIFESPVAGAWYYDAGVGYAGSLNTVLSCSGIVAVGTNQATAVALTADINRLTTVSVGTGVVLPVAVPGLDVYLINRGANAVQVYGAGNDTIDGIAGSVGASQMTFSNVLFTCAVAGSWDTNGLNTGYAGNFPTVSFANFMSTIGITQAGATPILNCINRFTTVGAAGGACVLPISAGGMQITVTNAAGANSMNIFPSGTDNINSLGASTAYALAAGKTAAFTSAGPGVWHAIFA